MLSVLDRLDREDVRLHQTRYLTLPLSVYEGTWTHSSYSLCKLLLQAATVRLRKLDAMPVLLGDVVFQKHSYDHARSI